MPSAKRAKQVGPLPDSLTRRAPATRRAPPAPRDHWRRAIEPGPRDRCRAGAHSRSAARSCWRNPVHRRAGRLAGPARTAREARHRRGGGEREARIGEHHAARRNPLYGRDHLAAAGHEGRMAVRQTVTSEPRPAASLTQVIAVKRPGLARAKSLKAAAASAEPPPSPAATGRVLISRKRPSVMAGRLRLGGLGRGGNEIVAGKRAARRDPRRRASSARPGSSSTTIAKPRQRRRGSRARDSRRRGVPAPQG